MKTETFFTIIVSTLAIASVLYIVSEFKKPVSKDTMVEIYEQERTSKCYGDHAYHCNLYYDEIINKIINSN